MSNKLLCKFKNKYLKNVKLLIIINFNIIQTNENSIAALWVLLKNNIVIINWFV